MVEGGKRKMEGEGKKGREREGKRWMEGGGRKNRWKEKGRKERNRKISFCLNELSPRNDLIINTTARLETFSLPNL